MEELFSNQSNDTQKENKMTSPLGTDSQKVKKALQLLHELKESHPETAINDLLQKVVVQYDLSPKDSEALYNAFNQNS